MWIFLWWQITPKTSIIMAIMGIAIGLVKSYIIQKKREKKIKNNKKRR